MKSKQLIVVFWAHVLFVLGCVGFWIFLFYCFGGNLFDDVWLLVVGMIIGLQAFVDLLVYRIVKRREAVGTLSGTDAKGKY